VITLAVFILSELERISRREPPALSVKTFEKVIVRLFPPYGVFHAYKSEATPAEPEVIVPPKKRKSAPSPAAETISPCPVTLRVYPARFKEPPAPGELKRRVFTAVLAVREIVEFVPEYRTLSETVDVASVAPE
jgi:hypothetical protein